jgi:chemotaxis protein methyltransferase CheR
MSLNVEARDTEILKYFSSYIEKEVGIIYSDHNAFQLRNRLEDIAKMMGEASIHSLFTTAQKGITGAFKQMLLDVATNNETSFFRDPKVFRAIEQTVLPALLEEGGENKELKIWSAASSTGQEAVSLAILLEEQKAKVKKPFGFRIVGSDISERVLTKAREGIYTQLEVQRGLPAALMIKYFTKDERDRWCVRPSIRQKMEFRKQNLKESFTQIGKFGIILCRNVLIYQNVDSKKEILDRVSEQLEPGGFLILGSGESLIGLSQDYHQVAVDGAVIYRKKQIPSMAAA